MTSSTGRPAGAAAILLLGILALGLPGTASAQYFGQNQVQYRPFDFQILQTENFDIYFYPEEEEASRDVARMSERWYRRLSDILGHTFNERQPVVMYATHPHFQQTNIISGISEGTGGVTEAFKQRVVLPFSYSYEETDHVLGHELVHAFQYDISGLGRAGGGIEAAAARFQVPLWFIEGMAEYLSVGPIDPHTAMWLRDGALRGDIPSIDRMTNDPNIFPYRWGQALWAYVGGRWGDASIGQILRLTGEGVPYPQAFQQILNISLDELSGDWHAAIRRAYLPMLAERPEAREVADPLITGESRGGSLNVAPVLSPDGQWVVFLSELDFIDIQLHLANANTGEVVRTLQKGTAFDQHFGSLRYIASAGTFSPDSRQFAFSALRRGADVIVILDVERGDRLREIRVPGVDEITNPTWSPDGRSIAFTGLVGGIADLYLLDIASGQATKLTDDKYSELHPAFSPDGSRIAFATDRGPETNFTNLTYGPYGLAIMDLSTRQIRLVPGMAGEKNINPQWTADGNGLYFISNRTGIPNIYKVDVNTGSLAQLTDLFIGVSGITDVSPALTVARNSSRALFTEFNENGYNIYALNGAEALAGTPVELMTVAEAEDALPNFGLLPPIPRPQEGPYNRVTQHLNNATAGLPTLAQAAAYEVVPYRPKLGLDYLGQPQVGVAYGGSAFGSGGLYGGIFGIFSDVLARHQVYAAVQAQGQLDEIGFALQYLNSRERWNFGGAAQRVPIVYGGYMEGMDPESPGVWIQRIARIRLFDTSIQGYAQYPFSQQQRIEFSAGMRRIGQDVRYLDFGYDAQTGQPLGYREHGEDGISLNLFEASAAWVYDSSLMGYTSPIAGQRYRFQVSPTFGELTLVQALADYRRYKFFNPFTLAARALHIGRYGPDSEATEGQTQIFQDMYLGQPWYVRGYYGAWEDCQVSAQQGAESADSNCALLQQLLGSRLGVVSGEIRVPLIRQLVIGSIGFPPIETFVFGDAGLSWSRSTSPSLVRGVPSDPLERGIMTSAGVGARLNVLGLVVVEIDYVNGFQRDRGWHWQFNFSPGF